ncbi:hypothetical protein [Kineococcus sp. SYSU DK018]|uniref:hypothetical protein n=1 Tax=Kineococcus sp. SYSU DK018 TaxID=3383139 RepID=UPI003D7D1C9C
MDAALAPIMVDLQVPSGVVPTVGDREWQDDPGAASCWLRSSDGIGMGVWVQTGQPFTVQVLTLADQVREWAVEALWKLGRPASWPACPYHPDRHPLVAREHDDQAVWVCPVLDAEVSTIGALAGFRSRKRHLRRRTPDRGMTGRCF